MRVACAHDVAVPGRFVDGVTDGVARGNSHLAQQQHGGGGEVFAMAAPAVQQKTGQRRLVRRCQLVRLLPEAVGEFAGEKVLDSQPLLLFVRAGNFHL